MLENNSDNPDIQSPAPAPVPTYVPAKPRSSPLPIVFGFLVVIVVAVSVAIAYYKTQLSTPASISISPSPSPSPSLDPSPSATASSAPITSMKPISPPPSTAPVSLAPTLDIRFGNPSVNVKQTIDEGKGDGRVINREYTSIQVGQFDEVSSTWSPKVTTCFHFVSNENLSSGKDLKYSFSLDDKVESEGDMAQYDKIEAGRLYDSCHNVTTGIGKHIAKLTLNPSKSLTELTYVNNLGRIEWDNLPDKIAPNYTLTGPTQDGIKTCISIAYLSDNVTPSSDLKIEEKLDSQSWSVTTSTMYCLSGAAGTEHTYSTKITDQRGNINQQSKTFVLY